MPYRKARNICNSLNKETKRNYFKRATAEEFRGTTKFFNTVKPILTSKGFIHNENISIDTNGNPVEQEQKLTKKITFTINIVKATSGKSNEVRNNPDLKNDSLIIKQMIEKYKTHRRIQAVEILFL